MAQLQGGFMAKTKEAAEEKKLTIRIPDELHEELVKAAKQDSRSLNAEIIVLLRASLASR
jgi:predicted HicB family RNase H-like nuclease